MARKPMALLGVLLLAGCASYQTRIMDPWIGAPEAELVQKWGYPTSANDIVNIDAATKVYTYRSARAFITPQLQPCAVSFTLQNGVVIADKYEGENCIAIPRHES